MYHRSSSGPGSSTPSFSGPASPLVLPGEVSGAAVEENGGGGGSLGAAGDALDRGMHAQGAWIDLLAGGPNIPASGTLLAQLLHLVEESERMLMQLQVSVRGGRMRVA